MQVDYEISPLAVLTYISLIDSQHHHFVRNLTWIRLATRDLKMQLRWNIFAENVSLAIFHKDGQLFPWQRPPPKHEFSLFAVSIGHVVAILVMGIGRPHPFYCNNSSQNHILQSLPKQSFKSLNGIQASLCETIIFL